MAQPPPASAEDHDLDILRALFDKFDTNHDGGLDKTEFGQLLCQMMPTRAGDFGEFEGATEQVQFDLALKLEGGASLTIKIDQQFKMADTDGSGDIDFDEFVAYWKSVATNSEFDEASDMFGRFDKDRSGELDKEEFLALLNQIFPEHCDENESIMDAEFAHADVDGSNSISYPEFIMYYNRLKLLYESQEDADVLAAKKAAAKAARRASIEAPLVKCPGCNAGFLMDIIDTHQRSCEAYEMWRRNGGDGGNGGATAAPGSEGFVPCQFCKRTFFPDRLQKHLPACSKKHGGVSGIRETMTDGATLSRGAY
eukprot:CAMPEP_0115871822 /NCGR_PEP_ID=MMETSP0287-20121206/23090_1 /TAXON_ID=412157 /ORGANISM="Chrysochromulina rotalis, Strain UIO044" /LENGTH=310 /DNA_ID=CAMNT_0003326687 /DNA_START=11 /DNA_END=943 /DNA_ORIENTATION=-